MRFILFFFSFTPALLAAQLTLDFSKDSLLSTQMMPVTGSGNSIGHSNYDCVQHIRWDTIVQNTDTSCVHSWVYAEHDDVNSRYQYLSLDNGGSILRNLVPFSISSCPDEEVENFARICKICYQHECFTRTLSFEKVIKKSQYKILLEEIHKNSFNDRKE